MNIDFAATSSTVATVAGASIFAYGATRIGASASVKIVEATAA